MLTSDSDENDQNVDVDGNVRTDDTVHNVKHMMMKKIPLYIRFPSKIV